MHASAYPDTATRAAEFSRQSRLPHSFTRSLRPAKAQELVGQCEALFQQVMAKPSLHNVAGLASLLHNQGELKASFSGNVQKGTLTLTRGHSFYTRVEFQLDRVTIFQSGNSAHGFVTSDVAAVVNRNSRRASFAYGQTPELRDLLAAR